MFDVRTPLHKIHRPVRVAGSTFTATPGLWGYIDNNERINNITSTSTYQSQPEVLKPVFGNASMDPYASHDVEVGRIATLEGIFRAVVDGDGYQRTMGGDQATTAIPYTDGMELTVAYLITSATATTSLAFSKPADIGKLRPKWFEYETVVAVVEKFNSSTGQLLFQTVTPHKTGINIITGIIGSGNEVSEESLISGTGLHTEVNGHLLTEESILSGSGAILSQIIGSDDLLSDETVLAGVGNEYANISGSGGLSAQSAGVQNS